MSSARMCATSAQDLGSESGVALFRRAIIGRDEQAWAQLYQEFLPQVQTWISLEAREQPQLACCEGMTSLVNECSPCN